MRGLLLIALVSLIGCASMGPYTPGELKIYQSETDNVTHIEVKPGWVSNHKFALGLHQTSAMKPKEVYLITSTDSETVQKVTINVDGKTTELRPIDRLSDMDEYRRFQKRFITTTDLIKSMVEGKRVLVKLDHTGQTYSEGEFTSNVSYSAKEGFTKFLNQIQQRSLSQK
jgi:hypothetical protein